MLSHIAALSATSQQVADAEAVMARTPTPVRWRTHQEIAALLTGYQLLDPGLVSVDHWHPADPVSDHQAAQANVYGTVGLLPPHAPEDRLHLST
ncbi:hypothetical protein FHX42_001248 [Saccharopolyspora lacisalsi]|uniref:Uncharacterized protein n=1 Tax=Halosaccharopolyspora lacisalsi TaxID=1000566 RepID=A0A839DT41_9PSEU|nr:hypothetical protein [Halosaccharopolyspora lacisalsi]